MNMMPMEVDRVMCSQPDKTSAIVHESATDISSPGQCSVIACLPFSFL